MVVMASCCMCFESHHVACVMQCRYLDVCKYNREIFDTEAVQESEAERQQALRNVVIFLILSPFDNEQSDLLARVSEVRVSWPPQKGTSAPRVVSSTLRDWHAIAHTHQRLLSDSLSRNHPTTYPAVSPRIGWAGWYNN